MNKIFSTDIIPYVKKILPIIIFFIVFTCALASAEEKIPVKIKADKLKYIENSSLVEASGSVEVKFKEITIFADQLVLDSKTNIVTAEGNVRIKGLDYTAVASDVTYGIKNETSSYNDFKTILYPQNIKGGLFLSAKHIDDEKTKILGNEGEVTTCDYEHPHYFTTSKKVEYYPDDKIIGYNVTFYVLDVPIFWSPYIIYDLKRKGKRNWSIGHNEVEGDFIKTSWDYPYGQIFLDEMTKKSFGQGLTYYYKNANYSGDAYLYHIDEADTHLSDYVFKLNHSIGLTPQTKLGLNHISNAIYQVPQGRLNQSTYKLTFDHTSDRSLNSSLDVYDNRQGNQEQVNFQTRYSKNTQNTAYNFNLNQNKTDPRTIRISERLSHTQNIFSDKTKLNFNADYQCYIQNAGEYGNELLTPNFEISHFEDFYNVKYTENWRMDIDRELYANDSSDTYIESQPEITINFNPVDLNLFNLSSSLGYGWFHEVAYVPSIARNRDYSTSRYKTSLNAVKTIPAGPGTTINLNAGLDQFLYEPGDALNSFREGYALVSQGYNFFRNNLNYNRGISDGNSPFFFDKISTRYNNIKDLMVFYYSNNFEWRNECGFNYETRKYFNYDTNLMLNPIDAASLNFRSGFDIENQKYIDLISTAKLSPLQKLTIELSTVNDLNLGGLKQGNCLINLETASEKDWKNHWNFKLGYVYDTTIKDFKPVDLMVIKDLHCWEVKYTYSDYKKEFSFIFTLKAFPYEPFGYSGGRGFYFDSFEKALQKEVINESPTRY